MGKIVPIAFLALVIATFAPGTALSVDTRHCELPITDLFEQVSPAVVTITAIGVDPFSIGERIRATTGSGFVIDAEGLILTNAHVVFGRQAISVTLNDGAVKPAELVGADPLMDLALLRIEVPETGLTPIPMARENLPRVGEEVLAIGNPLGLEQTLTRGLVSGVNRVLPISPMGLGIPMIQTDAAVNPGNSGGPLINRCGEAVGLTTTMLAGAENIGFALPMPVVVRVLPMLVSHGRVIRPWVGIRGRIIRKEELGQIFSLPLADGFLIETVEPESPSDAAGLKGGILPIKVGQENFLFGGDIITAINGKPIKSHQDFNGVVSRMKIGDNVRLTFLREEESQSVDITVAERPILPWDLPDP